MISGYFGTPLARKLGLKPGDRVLLDAAPAHYRALVAPLPEGVRFVKTAATAVEMVHLFTTRAAELPKKLPGHRRLIVENGAIWVSWPKKAAKVATDVTKDVARARARGRARGHQSLRGRRGLVGAKAGDSAEGPREDDCVAAGKMT